MQKQTAVTAHLKGQQLLLFAFAGQRSAGDYILKGPASNINDVSDSYTSRGKDHTTRSGSCINPCVAELFASIFRHLKLELLTQFPALSDEKNYFCEKIDICEIKLFD